MKEPPDKLSVSNKQIYRTIKVPLKKILKGKKNKSIHTLLTLTRNPNGVILNRDKNASLNILKILKEYIFYQTRPIEFCRNKTKTTNG